MDIVLIVLIVIAVAAVAAGFAAGRSKKTGPQPPPGGVPTGSDEHPEEPPMPAYPGTDPPGDPGAEATATAGPGEPTPGDVPAEDDGPQAAQPSDPGGDAGRGGNA